MAVPTAVKRPDRPAVGPIKSRSFIVANGVDVYPGHYAGLDANGYARPWQPRADLQFLGRIMSGDIQTEVEANGKITGNTSADSPPRVAVDVSGEYEQGDVTVTGASALTDIGDPVWLTEAGAWTKTAPAPGVPPNGEIWDWVSSTTCKVKARAWQGERIYKGLSDFDQLYAPARYRAEENWLKRPALNATLAAATPNAAEIAASLAANQDWEIAGTNAADTDVAFVAGGGVSLTTAGADNDQMILQPHTDSNQSAWDDVTLTPNRAPAVLFVVESGASIAGVLLWLGLKLTNTPTVATDDDQWFLRFDTDLSNTNWMAYCSKAGTDYDAIDTGVALAASTRYFVAFVVRADGVGEIYIGNGAQRLTRVAVSVDAAGAELALTAAAAFKPFLGVQALAAAAKAITVRKIAASMDYDA